MKYLGGKFSLHMPGSKAQTWPTAESHDARVECLKCGAFAKGKLYGADNGSIKVLPHPHLADLDRPRQRICFG